MVETVACWYHWGVESFRWVSERCERSSQPSAVCRHTHCGSPLPSNSDHNQNHPEKNNDGNTISEAGSWAEDSNISRSPQRSRRFGPNLNIRLATPRARPRARGRLLNRSPPDAQFLQQMGHLLIPGYLPSHPFHMEPDVRDPVPLGKWSSRSFGNVRSHVNWWERNRLLVLPTGQSTSCCHFLVSNI